MKFILAFILSTTSFYAWATTEVVIETSMGNIEVELTEEKAPISVENFLNYIDTDFYTDTIVHRAVKDFVIQAGGVLPDMTQKTPYAPIQNEATNGLSNLRGTISMARTSEIHSASSHFFINTVDNIRLDHKSEKPNEYGYAVFGKVTAGMDVVDAIQNVQVHTDAGYANTPIEKIMILKIRRK